MDTPSHEYSKSFVERDLQPGPGPGLGLQPGSEQQQQHLVQLFSTFPSSKQPEPEKDGFTIMEEEMDETLTYSPTWEQYLILLTLNLAIFIDVVSGSALFVVVSQTARDLNLSGGNISWILTAYVITFASFQLSAGRLADLWSAGWVFIIGISIIAVLNLVLSFLSNSIVFLVLRALQGVAAAMTIPSSYNITVRTFPKGKQRNRAIAILGLVGSVSYSLGVVIGGLFEQASWRWLFRMIALMAVIATVAAILVIPKNRIVIDISAKEILLRMDPIGLLLSVAAVILLVLALTSGPEYGWNDARFFVALPASGVSFVTFFVWEAKARNEKNAMLPAIIWKTPTVMPLVFLNLSPFIFWATTSYGFPTYWQEALGRSGINSAVRLLPIGLAAFATSVIIQLKPKLLTWRQWPIFCAIAIAAASVLLFIFGHGGAGSRYWSFAVPAFILGSAACQYAFLAINVFVITSVPPERAGVAGGLMSVVMQLGNAFGLAMQASCLNHKGGLELDWSGYARGFWAVFGWIVGSIMISGTALMYELRRGHVSGEKEKGSGMPCIDVDVQKRCKDIQ